MVFDFGRIMNNNQRLGLEELIENNLKQFEILSNKKIGGLSQYLILSYADSFIEEAKKLKDNSRFKEEFKKFHKAAVTYGYIGFSSRKNNGIVDIKKTDIQLIKDYEKLLTQEVIEKYNLNKANLQPVKIVAHVPNGNRLIGVLDKTESQGKMRVVILGISNYNGKTE